MDYLDKLENKISQGARFQMAIEANYFWCVKTETILDSFDNDPPQFALIPQVENYIKSSYILN